MPRPVGIAPWAGDYPPGLLAASLYALPPQHRLEGAKAAQLAGCRLHCDVILRPDDGGELRHVGLTVDELRGIISGVPDAQIDVHLIVLGELPTQRWAPTVRQAVDRLARLGPALLAARTPILTQVRDVLQAHPTIEVWCELWPEVEAPDPLTATGSLLMLIEPGTKHRADTHRLEAIDALAQDGPVGIDGGVTRNTIESALSHGAAYIVVGRALFEATPDSAATGRRPRRTSPA